MSDVSLPDAQEPEDDKKWYYSIELENGVTTKGNDHANLATTRSLLRAVAFEEQDCLDIGTQEAVIPILLKKGGAKRMVAYDRRDLSDRLANLQRIYGVNFDYIAGRQLTELPGILDAQGARFFDLVVFSGVLYHMINPLGLLALVRGMCKTGGLFVIETAALQDSHSALTFNEKGWYGGASNYFIPTTTWLDYVLRLLGLRPLAVSYVGNYKNSAPIRVAVLCRSEAAACPLDPGDTWASAPFHERAFRSESQVDWEGLRKTSSSIGLKETLPSLRGSVYDAVKDSAAYSYRKDELRLSLNSTM